MGTAIYNVLHRYNLAKIREALHGFRGSAPEQNRNHTKPHRKRLLCMSNATGYQRVTPQATSRNTGKPIREKLHTFSGSGTEQAQRWSATHRNKTATNRRKPA